MDPVKPMRASIKPEDAQAILENKEKQNPANFKQDVEQLKKPQTVAELHEKTLSERVKDGVLIPIDDNTSSIHGAADDMWKNVPYDILPSLGLFYPDNTHITIRSAEVAEIRHWSTMDEYDAISINDRMNFIIEKCARLQDDQRVTHDWREIKEIDRLFLIIRIYELTFPNRENVLNFKFGCTLNCKGDGSYKEDVPLTSDMLNMFKIPEDVMQYYDPKRKCFIAHSEKYAKDIYFYLPSIGVSQFIKNMINDARLNNKFLDVSFAKLAPYLFKDYDSIKKEKEYERMRNESFRWDKNMLLFINGVSDRLEAAIDLNIKKECPKCGITLEMPLFFRGGFTIKSFFSVSTGLNDLI